MKAGVAALALLAVLVASGCSDTNRAASAAARPSCPPAWKPGWQKLANRIRFPVYCPAWMPSPLTGEIGGEWDNGVSVGKDRSFLVSFLWHENRSGDVHVNFRGYPGQTRIPRCLDIQRVGGVKRRKVIPCFSDPQATRRIGRLRVTVYTVNRDADQWHVLYAWRARGSLYAVSEHVAPPLTYRKVIRNMDRLVRNLVVVRPTST